MNSKLGYELHPDGARRLICAVIDQAQSDFKHLVKRGKIVNGAMAIPKYSKTNFNALKLANSEVQRLIDFFKALGPLVQLLHVAGIQINPNAARRKLGIAT